MKALMKALGLLRTTAAQTAWFDDSKFIVSDYAGGNIDDAYGGGFNDGRVDLARIILQTLGDEDNNEAERKQADV